MSMKRASLRVTVIPTLVLLFVAHVGLGLTPNRSAGQEPESIIKRPPPDPAQINPEAQRFEFQHAWKARVRAVRQARMRLEQPGRSYSPSQLEASGAAVSGILRIPVIAGAFSDVAGPYSQAQYQERLFGDGGGAVSLRDLYEEMSGGLFSIQGTVAPWVTLSMDRAFYEPSEFTHERYGRAFEFLTESLDAVDPTIDFSQFDNDGPDGIPNSGDDDGIVDVVAFIYPTQATSCGGTGIWPHRSQYYWRNYYATGNYDWYYTDDPAADGSSIVVGDYIIQSGISCDGVSLMGSGTMAHEMGHALDLPDLYDTDDDDGSNSAGIGHWGLMSSGNYRTGTSPAHLSAWSKDFLGWVSVQSFSASQTGLTLPSIQEGRSVFRIDIPSSNEHFLLSNRQAIGSDAFVHGTGLLIWHVDRDQVGGISEVGNGVNTIAYQKGVDLEEADGQDDLDWMRNRGDDGDPFPGSWGSHEFHAQTYPSSTSYDGGLCGIGIRNISEYSGNVSFDLAFGERWGPWGDASGDGVVDTSDISPIYWYHMGYRDAEEQQVMPSGDINGDGEVDLMDGFILHSSLRGISVPTSNLGQSGWADCDPLTGPQNVFGAPEVIPSDGAEVSRGGSGS